VKVLVAGGSSPVDIEWLAPRRSAFAGGLWMAALATGLLSAALLLIRNVWYGLAAAYAVLIPCAFRTRIGCRELSTPKPRHIVQGALGAAGLYVLGWIGYHALTSFPALAREVPGVFGWKDAVPPILVIPLLLFIVAGEEIVWRCAVGLPLAARLGPWTGSAVAAVAFAAGHLALSTTLLLAAAFGMGFFWSVLVVKTRSVWPAFVCHVLWDILILWGIPYAR